MVLMNLFAEQQWRYRYWNRLMDMAEGGGRKRVWNVCTTICEIDSQGEFAV